MKAITTGLLADPSQSGGDLSWIDAPRRSVTCLMPANLARQPGGPGREPTLEGRI
jgi:hypothetical protein